MAVRPIGSLKGSKTDVCAKDKNGYRSYLFTYHYRYIDLFRFPIRISHLVN